MRLTTEELRSVVVVAGTGSLTGAAALLHVSISALSRRIARVEQQTRLRLFRRQGALFELTASGREFAARLVPLLRDLSAAIEEARISEPTPRHLVLLGVAPAMRSLLPRAASRLLRENPSLTVELTDAAPGDLRAAVLSGAVTLGLGFGVKALSPLAFEPLLRDTLVLACPPGHRLATRRAVAWRELETERLIGLRDGEEQDGIEDQLAEYRLTRLFAVRLRSSAAVVGMAEAGWGLAVMPRSAVPPRWRGFTMPLLREPGIAQSIGIWSRSGAPEDVMMTQLRSHLRSAVSPEWK